MLSRTFDYVTGLGTTFRPADLLDVIVVSALVYAALIRLSTARSRFVVGGIVALCGLYAVARALEMRLTLLLFQVGLTVALVGIVVIFQEELRRAFERIAKGGWLARHRTKSLGDDVIDTLVAATMDLARRHSGALIVLRGLEPLERHISGGIALGGRLSEPLLYSIFDTGSPGHDGAVLVEDGSVSRFAVHLPLSTAVKGDAPLGTRHTAALGLSECSDALVIVVSEERGVVSVAHDGDLVTLGSADELRQRIAAFVSHVSPAPRSPWYRQVFAHHLLAKAFSVLIASAAWRVVYGYENETYTRTFTVPVVYIKNPPDLWLEPPNPDGVRVSLFGTAAAFREVDSRKLVLKLDVSGARAGAQHVSVEDAGLELPQHLSIRAIDPPSISVTANRTVTISVPVRPQLTGRLPATLTLQSSAARPSSVTFVVRQSERGRFTDVHTEPVDLDRIRETTTLTRRLLVPAEARLDAHQPEEVALDLVISPR